MHHVVRAGCAVPLSKHPSELNKVTGTSGSVAVGRLYPLLLGRKVAAS